jgi:HSP20 family protein
MAANGKALPVRRSLLEDLEDPFQTLREIRLPFPFARLRPWLERETPAVDVFERDGKVVVKAEMPGIKAEDIDVSVSEGQITISGERKEETEVKEQDYYRCERSYGRIYRSLALPAGCDTQQAEASLKDGVLEVVAPKKVEASTRKVDVKPV